EARRTQGSDSTRSRTAARSTRKKLPRTSGSTAASSSAGSTCANGPSKRTWRTGKFSARSTQSAANAAPASRNSARAARQARRPPLTTASPPRSCARLPDDAHLGLEAHAETSLHGRARVLDQALDIRGARAAVVHDEVRVQLRDAGAPDALALEPGGLDQARGMVPRRVLEHRPRV